MEGGVRYVFALQFSALELISYHRTPDELRRGLDQAAYMRVVCYLIRDIALQVSHRVAPESEAPTHPSPTGGGDFLRSEW